MSEGSHTQTRFHALSGRPYLHEQAPDEMQILCCGIPTKNVLGSLFQLSTISLFVAVCSVVN